MARTAHGPTPVPFEQHSLSHKPVPSTQVEECVNAAITDRVGAAVQQATGQDAATNAASASNCPTDVSSSGSSVDAENIMRKTHFVGGHPREYLDLNLGLVDRLFCYR